MITLETQIAGSS